MLNDQWNIIQNDTTCKLNFYLVIDMKQKRFLEKRDLGEVMNETFGCSFDTNTWFHWFLPIKTGGCIKYFEKIKNRENEY